MTSLNQCNFTGNLVANCEQSFTPSGVSCIKFTIASNDSWKDKTTNELKKHTEYIPVKLWRNDGIASYLIKGKSVRVTGKYKTDKYEKDGEQKYYTYIEASMFNGVELLGGRDSSDSTKSAPAQPVQRPDEPF